MTTNDALRRTLTETLCDGHNHPNPMAVWGENLSKLVTATETALEEQFILIDRATLPDVDTSPSGLRAGDMHSYVGDTPERCRANANGLLALALHIEANPPIDKVEVGNLRALLEAAPSTDTATDLATWLVRNGATVR